VEDFVPRANFGVVGAQEKLLSAYKMPVGLVATNLKPVSVHNRDRARMIGHGRVHLGALFQIGGAS
jgi:hypothetical protein